MNRPAKILIQFPTRERPRKFLMIAKKYADFMQDKENWLMNVSCDDDDITMNNPKMISTVYKMFKDHVSISFNSNKGKYDACNADVGNFDFDILLLASDDMVPKEVGYDNVIRKYFSMYFPDYDGVLHFDDGSQGEKLNTLPIIGEKYYNRFEYVYNPSYISRYAGHEFDAVSRTLGRRKYIERTLIKHEHPNIVTTVLCDNLYRKNSNNEIHDKTVFFKRKAVNFDL